MPGEPRAESTGAQGADTDVLAVPTPVWWGWSSVHLLGWPGLHGHAWATWLRLHPSSRNPQSQATSSWLPCAPYTDASWRPRNPPGSLETCPGHAPWVLSSSGSAATSPLTQTSREKPATMMATMPGAVLALPGLARFPEHRVLASSLLPPPRGSLVARTSLVGSLCMLRANFLIHDLPFPEWWQALPTSPSRGGGLCLPQKG